MSIVAPVHAAAPAPRSRRALVTARMLWVARLLTGLVITGWSLLLIAWLVLLWGILPHIEQWRGQVEARASQVLGVPVRIGSIQVRSRGWIPSIELRDVVLLDQQARPALELPRVMAALSARSVLALELRFEQLLIEGAHLEVRRDAQGRLFVAGIELSGPGGDSSAANWLFRQYEFAIRGGSLRWTDEQRNAPSLALTDVQITLRNSPRHHDMRIDATPPTEWGARFSARGRFTQPLWNDSADWHHWDGSVYVDLPRADVSELRRYVNLPFELTQGDGSARAWLDIQDGRPELATVDLALREVALRLSPDVEPLTLEQIEGRLEGQHNAEGYKLAAQQFGFVTGDGVRWPRSNMQLGWRQHEGQPTGGNFNAQRLDLGLIAQVASRLPLGNAVRRLLGELNPQGIANDLSTHWNGTLDAPSSYQIKGVLSGLSLTAKPSEVALGLGRPGLRNATLALNATEHGGTAQLGISDGSVDLPGVFEEAVVPLDQLNAQLLWRVEPAVVAGAAPKLSVTVKDAKFANADAQAQISVNWATGVSDGTAQGGRFPGLLELDGTITNGVATRVARYLPLGIPEGARQYVQQAVRGGHVSRLTMRVKGNLRDFPFYGLPDPKEGEFRIAARIEDASFAYVPGTLAQGAEPARESPWPPFTQLSGDLIFDRATMEIRHAQARLFGVELSRVQGGIRNLADQPILALEGQARGPLADMLQFVNKSPVGGWTGRALAQASGSGQADLKLALSVPLADVEASTVKGSVALPGNDLRISPDTPLLGGAKGRIDFTHKSVTLAGTSARILGGDATFGGGTQADGSIRFRGQGTVTAEGLRRATEMGALSQLAGSLGGQTTYQMDLGVVRGHPEFSLNSNLVGLSSELPLPLRKTADAPLPLRVQTAMVPDSLAPGKTPLDVLRLDLGNVLQAQYLRDLSSEIPKVLRGGIGVFEPAPMPTSGVSANINVPSVNADAWGSVLGKMLTASAGPRADTPGTNPYAPTTIALRAPELLVASRRISQVVAGVSQEGGVWRANLNADQLNGYVEYRSSQRSAQGGRIFARLSRLSLPKSDADDVEQLLDQPAATVPALDIVVDDFELRGKRLGRVEIEAVNASSTEGRDAARVWNLKHLAMTTPEARFRASGHWAAVSAGSSRRQAVLDFNLDLSDSGAFLAVGHAQGRAWRQGQLVGAGGVDRLTTLARHPEPDGPSQPRRRVGAVPEGRAGRCTLARRIEPTGATAASGARFPRSLSRRLRVRQRHRRPEHQTRCGPHQQPAHAWRSGRGADGGQRRHRPRNPGPARDRGARDQCRHGVTGLRRHQPSGGLGHLPGASVPAQAAHRGRHP